MTNNEGDEDDLDECAVVLPQNCEASVRSCVANTLRSSQKVTNNTTPTASALDNSRVTVVTSLLDVGFATR